MATTCFGQPGTEDADPAIFVEAAGHGAGPFAGLGAKSSGEPSEGAALAINQMRLAIENGLLIVLGPEGDAVPPGAFAAAAALQPDTLMALADGTTAPASRVAAVLGAQTLGRLGAAEQPAGWIQAMLREGGDPQVASEDELRGEAGGLAAPAGEPAPVVAAVAVVADRLPEDPRPLSGSDATGPAEAVAPADPDEAAPAGLDPPSTDSEDPSADAEPQASWLGQSAEPAPDGGLDLDRFADRLAADHLAPETPGRAPAGPADGPGDAPGPARTGQAGVEEEPAAAAGRADLDPDSMVLVVMRGVPEDARLSTGVRDDDGAWLLSPLDLPTVTISLAPRGEGVGRAQDSPAEGIGGELCITGIAVADDGEFVTMSETVPLADYVDVADCPDGDDPGAGGAGEPAPAQAGGSADPGAAPGPQEPRAIALALGPQVWTGDTFDALVIRDLPAGARLTAGAYDAAIGGWVLRPQDLDGLAILPPLDLRTDFTVTLVGIVLHQGRANAARILARLPVRLA